ncbi:MAG: hypothetical protein V7731_08590 [Amphritea sp.]
MRINNLNFAARLGLSCFLLTVILGAISATTLIGLLYSKHNSGFNIPEMSKVQAHYSDSILSAAMKGSMYQYVAEDSDIETVTRWIASGAKNNTVFQEEVMYILEEDCLKCHSRNSQMTKAITSMPLGSYEDVVQYTEAGYSWTRMAKAAHIHLFGIAVFLVIVSLIMAFSSYSAGIKCLLISAGWIALWLDIASWWLAKFSSVFAYVIAVSGSIEIGAVVAMSSLCLLNMWFKLPNFLLEKTSDD